MSILKLEYSDFGKGKWELHKGMYENTKIQSYIDRYEKKYLIKLLGVDLFNEFVADLDSSGIPQTTRFVKIYEPFEYDNANCNIVISDGMIEMIKGIIYFQYMKDQTNQMTVTGNVRPLGENSENVSTLNNMMYNRYNEGIMTYRSIQDYICENNSDYLKYNGIGLKMAYWI
jgi:hypothetical protein